MANSLLEQLRSHRTLGSAPEEELAWMAEHGRLGLFEVGKILAAQSGDETDGTHVVLSGRIAMYMTRQGERRRAMEWLPGDVTGVLPYSRMKNPPGDTVAEEPSEVLTIHRDDFPALAANCHVATGILVHVMIDRARTFTSTDLHDEKIAALGRMAAGLAHELNNPASAVVSEARLLLERLDEAEDASRSLGAAQLSAGQLDKLDQIRAMCQMSASTIRTPIEQADHEDRIADWLADHGADTDTAGAIAETSVGIDALDALAAELGGESLDAALRWMAAVNVSRELGRDIEHAASRIHDLVRAVQGFTDMDRGMVARDVDVAEGLDMSVRVLRPKAKAKSAGMSLEVAPGLPAVWGFRGELNQIWVNLIGNALDAVDDEGRVDVRAELEGEVVVVRVIDNGPGISAEVREHIFEPFFTTKGVGEGTGLGLDIVRRLVQRNEGEIEVISKPGRTEFRVDLPISQ